MGKTGKIAVAVIGVIVVLAGGFVVYTLNKAGVFLTIESHGPKPLFLIEGFEGNTEDLDLLPDGKSAFVSSSDFKNPEKGGYIYHVDLTKGARPRVVSGDFDAPFNPHGIDLWEGPNGELKLFVVNHGKGSGFTKLVNNYEEVEHTIEIFAVTPENDLVHETTVRGEALFSPNSVAATGPNTFFATNDHGFPPGWQREAEDWLQLPAGDVVYWDGSEFHVVYEGTRYANGVVASPDGKKLWMVETTGALFHSFSVEDDKGSLKQLERLASPPGMDNLFLDDDGVIWTAGHPKMLDLLAHAKDPKNKRSASAVVRYVPGEETTIEELYLNDGEPLSGSTAAVTNGDVVVVGAVAEPHLLVLPRN